MALGAYARAGGLGEPSLVGMSVGGMVGAAAGLGYPHHIDYYSPNAVGMPGGAASRADAPALLTLIVVPFRN